MKVITEELEQCEVLLTVEIEPAKEQDMLTKAAKRIAREVRIPGFRPGKAPYRTVVRRFGIEAVQQEALEHSVEKLITDALDEADLKPYAQIQVDGIDWNPLIIKVKVPVEPKVELGDYRDIRLEVEDIEVSEAEVDEMMAALQEQNAIWAPVERPAEIGDLISMSVTEKDGDEVLVDQRSIEYVLTEPAEADESDEVTNWQPDLTTPLLGLSEGDTKTFTINYPEDFQNEEYAGKEITFIVDVSSIKEQELDPLDDDFAQSVGDFDTLEALKAKTRENIKRQKEYRQNSELGNKVLDQIVEAAEKVEWPSALEEEYVNRELKRYEQQIKQAGLTMDGYLNMQNKTQEQLREETQKDVVVRIKRELVLGKIAKLERLEVSNSEILEQAKFMADLSGGDDTVWRNILASETYQAIIAGDVLSSKVIQRLAVIAKGEASELTDETLDETSTPLTETMTDESEVTSDDASEPEATEAEADETGGTTPATADEDAYKSEDESNKEPVTTEA